MNPIESYLVDRRRDGEAIFLQKHDHPVLVVTMPDSAEEDDWGFNTNTFKLDRRNINRTWRDDEKKAMAKVEGLGVLPVTKSPDSPWRGRISLGRARNNDMVVPHNSVSKLHAHFTVHDDGSVRIADSSSHNGTTVNGEALAPNTPHELVPGAQLTFGEVAAVFYPPRGFSDFLAGLFDS